MKEGVVFFGPDRSRIIRRMQQNTEGNLSCFSIEYLWNIHSVFNQKCGFWNTMDYLFQKCISIYNVVQEAVVQAGRGGFQGWCCCMCLGIFSCWHRRWVGVGRGQVSEMFCLPFRWVEISIGFAPTSSWGFFFVSPHSSLFAPSASSMSSGLAIAVSSIGWGEVGGLGCINESI